MTGLGCAMLVCLASVPQLAAGQTCATTPATGVTDSAGARGPRTTAVIDTTITLAIADRGWQREQVDAGVALGAAGTAGPGRAPWHACAGASAHLGRVTARLSEVFGTIHLKADPRALDAIGHAARLTPPAGPPRR